MTTEELLKAATPRPWIPGQNNRVVLWAGNYPDLAQAEIDRDLIVLAVNSYEDREKLIGQLVEAVERTLNPIRAWCGTESEEYRSVKSALAAAKARHD